MSEAYVGVARSTDGWVAVVFDRNGFDHAEVFEEVGQLWTRYEKVATRVLVDVPRPRGKGERRPRV